MKTFSHLVVLSAATLFTGSFGRSIFRRDVNVATTDPNDDPFYAQPANISKYNAGDVIDQRPITTNLKNDLGQYLKATQLKYRTLDGQGKAVSTLATLWIPSFPKSNPSKIFSYQVPEDAINLDCAPSWAWVNNSSSQNTAAVVTEGKFFVNWALNQGFYVIQPDAEGLQSTWLVGKMEGQATLDANRAVLNYLKLDATTKHVLYGYSGGAHTTVWAASLAATYAPKLNIVGAVYGGTPVDLEATFTLLNSKNQSILAGEALFGLAQGYPALQQNYQTGSNGLTTQGKALQKLFLSRNYCPAADPGNGIYNGTNWNDYFKGPLLQNQALLTVAGKESLLMNVSTVGVPVPTFPRLQYHGKQDTTVPYDQEVQYVQQQCASNKGANILFYTFPNADHVGAELVGQPYAKAFTVQAFDGNTPNCACGDGCYNFGPTS